MSIFDFLFGFDDEEDEELTIEEQVAQLWFSIGLIAQLFAKLPVEDLQGADITVKALDGALAVHLKGKDLISGVPEDVDIKLELNRKILLEDSDGDFWVFVYGLSRIDVYPQLCSYWYAPLVPVYKRGNPKIKPSLKAYTYCPN